MTRTVVIGAGLSGLACAFDLARAGRDVVVLEAAARPGGVVGTIERDGFRFEAGPNTVLASAAAFRRLCGDLGIADRLVPSAPEAKLRYLWSRGKLVALPSGPGSFLRSPLLSAGAKLRLASEPLRRYRPLDAEGGEPSLASFLEDRLGAEATRVLAGAFVRGVYAAELGELGAQSAFPTLYRMAADHGGLLRGALAKRKETKRAAAAGGAAPEALPGPETHRGALLSLPEGLGELGDALARELGSRLRLSTRASGLERDGERWRVRVESAGSTDAGGTPSAGGSSGAGDSGGTSGSSGASGASGTSGTGGAAETLACERVVLATQAGAASALLAPFAAPELPVHFLDLVRHADLAVVHLGFAPGAVTLPSGFGFLVPPGAGAGAPRVLGTIFTTNLFAGRAPAGATVVTSMIRSADLAGADDAGAVELARADLALALGGRSVPAPIASNVTRWSGVIPRYSIGHAQRMEDLTLALAVHLPGIELAGSYVAGVSVEEVIARGRAVARAALEGVGAEVRR